MPFPPPVLISMPCGPHPGPPPASTVERYRYSDGPCSGVRCFAKGRGLKIAAYYIQNESGASLKQPRSDASPPGCCRQATAPSSSPRSSPNEVPPQMSLRGLRIQGCSIPSPGWHVPPEALSAMLTCSPPLVLSAMERCAPARLEEGYLKGGLRRGTRPFPQADHSATLGHARTPLSSTLAL
jgi:hypothetical protein